MRIPEGAPVVRCIGRSTRIGTMTETATVQSLILQPDTNAFARILGEKQYELTNHLGNVLVTITDQKKPVNDGNGNVANWNPKVVSYSDYYPFGQRMEARSGSLYDYKHGFNGMMEDDEIYRDGNSYTAEFWQYDPRVGRRWNVDPMAHEAPGWSPYRAFFDNPINYVDPAGSFETRYEDEDGYLLLDTDDGSDKTVTVANDDVENFKSDVALFDGDEDVLNTEVANDWLTRNHSLYATEPYDGPTVKGGSGLLELLGGGPALIGKAKWLGRAGSWLKRTFKLSRTTSKYLKFGGDEAVEHFGKHGKSVMDALGKKAYNLSNYLDDANHIVNKGTYVPELNGYVKLIGGKGSAKYGFVGLNNAGNQITTFHIKTAKELSKKAPSLGIGF